MRINLLKSRCPGSLLRLGILALWICALLSSGCATFSTLTSGEPSAVGSKTIPAGENPVGRPTAEILPRSEVNSVSSAPAKDKAATGFDGDFAVEDIDRELAIKDGDAVPLVRVSPEYPAFAEQHELEGWVTVEFTVSKKGAVTHARVVDSTESTFHRAAIDAIRKWKYAPKIVDKKPVERPGLRVTLDFSFGKPCEYKRVYVNPDNLLYEGEGINRLEDKRLTYLELASDVASRMGLQIVPERSDAYFEIRTGAHFIEEPDVELFLTLNGTLKLHHHIFVSLTSNSGFPYRGRLGGSHAWLLKDSDSRSIDHYPSLAEAAMRQVWERDRVQIEALCEVRRKLIAEGWADIEELRQQLVTEMVRARAKRARETRNKGLSIEVEG